METVRNTMQPPTEDSEVLNLATNKATNTVQTEIQQRQPKESASFEQQPDVEGTSLPLGTDGGTGIGGNVGVTAPLVSSWESGAEKQSGIKFQQDIATAKGQMLRSRQEMDQGGSQMQTQLALGEYMRGQSAEKAGWTGGYMLDQKRQGDYLRASIQAQMYGQQELQRYGMETQLEAARLAYDLGKQQLANQLYNEAYQRAVTDAQIFGYYVAPEIKDTLNQYNAALMTLEDNPEDERALEIKRTVSGWFEEQGINPNELSTFATVTFEREQYNQAKLDAVLASIGDDPGVFLARNQDGTYSTDPATGQYIKINFDTIGQEDFMRFVSSDDANVEGGGYAFADQAVKNYLNYLGKSTINSYFMTLGSEEEATAEGFNAWLAENPSALFQWMEQTFGTTDVQTIKDILGQDKLTVSLTGTPGTLSAEFDLTTGEVNGIGSSATTGEVTQENAPQVYTAAWFAENKIEGFSEYVSIQPLNNNPLLNVLTYKDSEGTSRAIYVYGNNYIGKNTEIIVNDMFGFQDNNEEFVYTFNFTDFDKKINDKANNWGTADEVGLNKNFKIDYYKKNGDKDTLNFELGNALNNYYGVAGYGLKDGDLQYQTIDPSTGTTSTLQYNDLKNSMKPGEFKFVRVSNQGNNPRRVLITMDPNGRFRLVEAVGMRGDTAHKTLLTMMGYSEKAFGGGIALG